MACNHLKVYVKTRMMDVASSMVKFFRKGKKTTVRKDARPFVKDTMVSVFLGFVLVVHMNKKKRDASIIFGINDG